MTILDGWRTRRRDRWADEIRREEIKWSFREACVGCGCAVQVDGPVAGTGFRAPTVTNVQLEPKVRLTVRMPEGMVPAQLQQVGLLVAPHVGGVQLRVTDRGHGWGIVEILDHDPLAGVLPLALPRTGPGVLIGRDEGGTELVEDWRRGAHTVAQGVTRSGKSVWVYGVLAQLAGMPDVVIGGVDPTGLLFRPFAGTRHADWQVSGVGDPAAIEALLQRFVDDMDGRIRDLPADRDTLEITDATPMRLVIMEELAGLYRAVDVADKDAGKRIRALLGRILAEGAKVGYRVLIMVQRAEAAVIDAFARAMCSWRISFRCDNRASVELLHPGCDGSIADLHTTAPPGVALVSIPGRALTRMRAPYLDGYANYTRAVRAACRTDGEA